LPAALIRSPASRLTWLVGEWVPGSTRVEQDEPARPHRIVSTTWRILWSTSVASTSIAIGPRYGGVLRHGNGLGPGDAAEQRCTQHEHANPTHVLSRKRLTDARRRVATSGRDALVCARLSSPAPPMPDVGAADNRGR
jgi:hypothetical protein